MFWYHEDLERLEEDISTLPYKPKLIFYGSSTFTLWNDLPIIFEKYKPLNLAFGGSTLAACTWFFDRVFNNIKNIEAIVIYAGENDLADGRHPEEVILFLENLLAKIRVKYGNIPCTLISIKPSVARNHLLNSIHFTNSHIQKLMSKDKNCHYVNIYDLMLDNEGKPNDKYFGEDGLHLNDLGYKLLLDTLNKYPEILPNKKAIKYYKKITVNSDK
ncbi:GDSL family lipase [Lutibacter sp. HS1-25]|uniref:GDSL-type esterase/lipase family protein n=1 Tax=Lutibacter sp. HS1-25 TaxID=2485000 RepID=UPI00101068BC|nr:GDSL-type esterase/lipase family protein [Lutibacter sp. HS1-25]RXP52262.1 GDSL family lipase [Lutibacter sp. HS1-25]